MTIILRSEKKAPLTIEELDNNFQELHNRLNTLEQGSFAIESLKKIKFIGHELVFISTFDREVGRCSLPTPPLQARGKWEPHQEYSQGDIISLKNKAFLCFKAHKSQDSHQLDLSKWQLILDGDFLQEKDSSTLQEANSLEGDKKSPSPKKHPLPLYEDETLPQPHLGQIGLLLKNHETPQLVYSTGQKWQPVSVK